MMKSILQLGKIKTEVGNHESLHISANRNKIKGYINVLRMRDKNTQQIILYVPSFDITSYGETAQKAREMLYMEIQSFLDHLLDLPVGKLVKSLQEMGWKNKESGSKDFSKILIDIRGNLNSLI